MTFGLTFDKLLIIGVIAVILIGPDRLPFYASQLAKLVKNLRSLASGAKERVRSEMGPDFDEIEWTKLDPRQYDPRRIIREALIEEEVAPVAETRSYWERQAARVAEDASAPSFLGDEKSIPAGEDGGAGRMEK